MTLKDKAFLVAEKAHSGQSYDIFSYMYHIRNVAEIAEAYSGDEEIVIASILHDVLEDTSLSYNDLSKYFGQEIAEIVYCVTDEVGRNRKERKTKTYNKIKNNDKALIVKLCDRIANVRHSKLYNDNLFQMYKKEYPDFIKELKDETESELTNTINVLWKVLVEELFS